MKPSPSVRLCFAALSAYAASALIAALIAQFFFGLPPCELCLYQRWPYVAVATVAALAAWRVRGGGMGRIAAVGCAALFLLDAGIAAYHTGVERGVFEGLDACSAGELPPGASLEDIRRQLMEAPVVSCKDAMFEFLGLSMAGWNVFFALGGCAASVIVLRQQYLRKESA